VRAAPFMLGAAGQAIRTGSKRNRCCEGLYRSQKEKTGRSGWISCNRRSKNRTMLAYVRIVLKVAQDTAPSLQI
jgi:hypothetical protein